MKKIFYFLCIFILLFLISIIPTSAKEILTCIRTDNNLHVRDRFINKNNRSDILSTPCVSETDKVYDFADLLTDSEEDELYNQVKNFIEISNYDLALVTTDNNVKNSEVEYADDFYDYNDFGYNETRDGLLILIDMDNRKIYISTTGYAIKMYDDLRIDEIIDAGYSELKSEKYYQTLSNMINKLTILYNQGFPSDTTNLEIDAFGNPHIIKYISYPFIGFLAGIITLIITLILYFRSRLKIKVGSTISYMKDKNLDIQEDHLYNTIVTHHVRVDNSSSSGSGGSSYHSSSSGSSHGGGGRGF